MYAKTVECQAGGQAVRMRIFWNVLLVLNAERTYDFMKVMS